ncbi:MAG TPA: DNA glycosylase [Mobilitalea sp.]|nr:DNA glycosylase [Mobilitalea sp.]
MLVHNPNFIIMQIADSGQCFRMNRMEDKEGQLRYSLVAYGRYLELLQTNDETVELSCSEDEYHQIWEEYFDLSYDYSRIIHNLEQGNDEFLKAAGNFGRGIRIVKQEPFEAAISFIISQNKNIPAIKNCIEAICRHYGELKINEECGREYWTFPSPEALAQAGKEELRALKTGYRDEYIIRASQAVTAGDLLLEELKKCSYEEAVKALKSVHGIGEKVANCIALYGLHHIEGFPVDVWILGVFKEIYQNKFDKEQYTGYAGIIQQYMFYYMRHLKGVN